MNINLSEKFLIIDELFKNKKINYYMIIIIEIKMIYLFI